MRNIQILEHEMEQLRNENLALNCDISTLANIKNRLEEENKILRQTIASLEKQNAKLRAENSCLKQMKVLEATMEPNWI